MAEPDADLDAYDAQDSAETFDETHNVDEWSSPDETRSFEPDLFGNVYDATSRFGDGDYDGEDLVLDASEYDPEDLDPEASEEDEDQPLQLKDGFEDEDDLNGHEDYAADDLDAPVAHGASGDAELEFVDSLDDRSRAHDRLARRYESSGELSGKDLEELGYTMQNQTQHDDSGLTKESKIKGGGAEADDVKPEAHPHQDELLDEGVEETFPASDPVSVKHIT